MATTRVKIPRTTLIERIQEAIDKAIKEHDEEIAKFEKEALVFLAKLPEAVEKRLKEIAALTGDDALAFVRSLRCQRLDQSTTLYVKIAVPGRDDDREWRHSYQGRGNDRYVRYGFKGYIEELEKTKRILEASTEELISVSANDAYADYL